MPLSANVSRFALASALVAATFACAATPNLTFVADGDGGSTVSDPPDDDAGKIDPTADAGANEPADAAREAALSDASRADTDADGDATACLTPAMPPGTRCCPSGEPCLGEACAHCGDCAGCAAGTVCCAALKGPKYNGAICQSAATANALTCP